VAEIGDITRFADARHLCSWAGLTPSHHESDDIAHRGHITKQGSTLVRWAAVEAVVRYHGGAPIAPAFMRIQQRRGTPIARVAAARKLLTLVFYGVNAKLVLEVVLVRDGRAGAIYAREEHRKVGARRPPLRPRRLGKTAEVSSDDRQD
jgi:hypothetical protein